MNSTGVRIALLFWSGFRGGVEDYRTLAREINAGRIRVDVEPLSATDACGRLKVKRRGNESDEHFDLKKRALKWLRSRGEKWAQTEVSTAVGISDAASKNVFVECGHTAPHKVMDALLERKVFAYLPFGSDNIYVFHDLDDPERFRVSDDPLTVEDL